MSEWSGGCRVVPETTRDEDHRTKAHTHIHTHLHERKECFHSSKRDTRPNNDELARSLFLLMSLANRHYCASRHVTGRTLGGWAMLLISPTAQRSRGDHNINSLPSRPATVVYRRSQSPLHSNESRARSPEGGGKGCCKGKSAHVPGK